MTEAAPHTFSIYHNALHSMTFRIRGLLTAVVIGVFLFTAACTTTTTVVAPTNTSAIQEMFELAFSDIHEIHLDTINIDALALGGLQGLTLLEPAAELQRKDGAVEFLINGSLITKTEAPSANDGVGWAKVVDELIAIGKKSSAKLENADDERIYKAVFSGILKKLDKYSRYAGAKLTRRNRAIREGFGGIGVSIKAEAAGARVVKVAQSSPASKAGLQVGDLMTAVDGAAIDGLPLQETVKKLRGLVHKKIRVKIERKSQQEPIVVVMQRIRIMPTTVHYTAKDTVAYIQVTSFNQDTARQLKDTVQRARQELGDKLKGLVLDLRDNPGGLLDQAVDTANLFIVRGRISDTKGRHRDSVQHFSASNGDISQGLPIAVLMNGASASAAEILASALQDNGRAILIGSRSFGKGTVQTVLQLPNEGELILTWARLLAPLGYSLNRLGVLPNICTSNASNVDTVLKKALGGNLKRRQTVLALRRSIRDDDSEKGKAVQASCPWRPRNGLDIDIEVAKEILESSELYERAVVISAPIAGS
jgi:carboxyl-terminal processing protease